MGYFFFFFNDTATTEIYTLSLHDALPILAGAVLSGRMATTANKIVVDLVLSDSVTETAVEIGPLEQPRSEEHTSELQSRQYLVCRLLLEKKTTISLLYRLFLLSPPSLPHH